MRNLLAFVLLAFGTMAANADVLVEAGDTINGAYRVYESTVLGEHLLHTVPLPKGNWLVIGVFETTSRPTPHSNTLRKDGLVPMREVLLAKVSENKTLDAAIYIKTNTEAKAIKWTDEFCLSDQDTYLYKNSYGTVLHDQRCTTIQPSNYLQKASERINYIRDFYTQRGIKFDSSMINVQNTEYDQTGKYLRFDTYYFPKAYGFDSEVAGSIVSSPWHKTNYQKATERVKFIRGLEVWSNRNSELLKKFFDSPSLPIEQIDLYVWQPIL